MDNGIFERARDEINALRNEQKKKKDAYLQQIEKAQQAAQQAEKEIADALAAEDAKAYQRAKRAREDADATAEMLRARVRQTASLLDTHAAEVYKIADAVRGEYARIEADAARQLVHLAKEMRKQGDFVRDAMQTANGLLALAGLPADCGGTPLAGDRAGTGNALYQLGAMASDNWIYRGLTAKEE